MKKYVMLFMLMVCMVFTACGQKTDDSGTAAQATEPTMENGLPASKQPDPNLPELDSVIIYGLDAEGQLAGQMDAVDELSEEALLEKLVEYGVLASGVQFVSLETQELSGDAVAAAGPGEVGPGAEDADAEATAVQQTGVLTLRGVAAGESGISEEDMRTAVIRTFAENYNLVELELVEAD